MKKVSALSFVVCVHQTTVLKKYKKTKLIDHVRKKKLHNLPQTFDEVQFVP